MVATVGRLIAGETAGPTTGFSVKPVAIGVKFGLNEILVNKDAVFFG